MPNDSIAQQWDELKETARAKAKQLVDAFPERLDQTAFYPALAERFCGLRPPTDAIGFLSRQAALQSVLSTIESARRICNRQREREQLHLLIDQRFHGNTD